MARATLEMFLKLTGANKTSKGLDKVSKSTKKLDTDVKKSTKANAQFSAGMSGLGKTAIAGGALFAAKSLADFSLAAIQAASSAQEAAGAFETTFAGAAEKLNSELAKNANLFGLTQSEAQQLISVFGSVAQGIGFTQQESADLSSELFVLAGDIASFNNITAGAEPVLQAFRSALVGEREALKTYGIAITEAEVQTKAFEQTGKTSADELTRQEKALATTALLFERATVQIGNAEREASGFAAQMLIARSSTQELREELGEELLPAAGEILSVFNEMRDEATPDLIDTFEDLNLQVLGLVEGFDRLRGLFRPDDYEEINKQLEEQFNLFPNGIFGLKGLGRERLKEIELEKEQKIQTQELVKQFENYNAAQEKITKSFVKHRQGIAITRVATQKYGEEIDKKLNPIFGEQNALLLTNIQLETDRNKLLKLITSANNDVAVATRNRNQAAKELQELQIDENVRDAEAAIRKAELQTKIALLTEAQSLGKDVALDLALAQAELAEAEFELANDSDRLKLAQDALTIAEDNLQAAIKNQETAIKKRNDQLVNSIDLTKQQANANQKLIDQGALLGQFRAVEMAGGGGFTPTPETTPAPTVAPQNTVSAPQVGGQDINLTTQVVIDEETIATTFQKVNTRIQNQGKAFLVR
jgi:hypothetical protein